MQRVGWAAPPDGMLPTLGPLAVAFSSSARLGVTTGE